MKDFPRFSEAKIAFSLTQPQMKVLIACISYFNEGIEADISNNDKNASECVKSLQLHVNQHYGFSIPDDYLKNPKEFSAAVVDMLENQLQDAYYSKQSEYVDMVKDELNDFYSENFDPEILGLQEGEIFQLAYQGGVTCSDGGNHG